MPPLSSPSPSPPSAKEFAVKALTEGVQVVIEIASRLRPGEERTTFHIAATELVRDLEALKALGVLEALEALGALEALEALEEPEQIVSIAVLETNIPPANSIFQKHAILMPKYDLGTALGYTGLTRPA